MQHTLYISSTNLRLHSAEQDLHILERAALGLLNKEPDKDEVGSTEDAEHEENSPADVVDGAWGHVCDGEVEEPLSGCCQTNTVGA